jgi:phosphonopyruvate decarboxylase
VIDADRFHEHSRERNIRFYSGVPCSYLTALLARLARAADIDCLAAANEGDAVATAAGAALAGRSAAVFMQNSGLGNAVSPLSSLTWTFGIPLLLLVTLRGDPDGADEPQHRLMGRITEDLLRQLEIPCERLPDRPEPLQAALGRACDYMKAQGRPYALVVPQGSFPGAASPEAAPPLRAPRAGRLERRLRGLPLGLRAARADALRFVVDQTPAERTVLIATTGYTSRELWALCDRPNHFYMVGSMGCAAALGLGLARVRPDLLVVVVDGDGALLMRLGSLAAAGAYAGANLVHLVLDNETHESTGGQPTLSAGVSLGEIARACGYGLALETDELAALEPLLRAGACEGPRFARVKIRPGAPRSLPRPQVSPAQVRERFARHLQECAPAPPGSRLR